MNRRMNLFSLDRVVEVVKLNRGGGCLFLVMRGCEVDQVITRLPQIPWRAATPISNDGNSTVSFLAISYINEMVAKQV